MSKTVILMRHARAEDARIGMRDFDRHLTEDGCAMTEKVAAQLQALGVTLDRIVASSAARTKETAEIMAAGVGSSAPLIVRDRLYNATADSFASAVGQECDDDETSVLVVGHNPGIGGLMCHWAEESLVCAARNSGDFRSRCGPPMERCSAPYSTNSTTCRPDSGRGHRTST
jgi:phosphohistidine phosphatase